jgi:hypothetical protein
MKHFYENINGWFSYDYLYTDAVNRAQDGALFVEIGSFKGRSSAFMAVEIINSGKKIKFDCIDEMGLYLGGSISPGINIRYKSLNDYTFLPLKCKSDIMNIKRLINSDAVDKQIDKFTDKISDNIQGIANDIDKQAPRFAQKVTDHQRQTAKFKDLKCSFCFELGSEVMFRKAYPYHKKCLRYVWKKGVVNSPKVVGRF